jgi:hypothetical protein
MPFLGPQGAPQWGGPFSLGLVGSNAANATFGVFSTDNLQSLLAEVQFVVASTTTAASAALFGLITSGQRYIAATGALNASQGATIVLTDLFPGSGNANLAAWPWPYGEVQVRVTSGMLTASLATFVKGLFVAVV